MEITELAIPHAWEVRPDLHPDDRGLFLEAFRGDKLESATGRVFAPLQGNVSVSKRNVVRGIHYADVGVGQAKYVSVLSGSIIDYVVDIRVGSPTFGQWTSVPLDDEERRAVFLSEGLGHLFVATSETAIVNYLVNAVYTPGVEHGVNPVDADVALDLPEDILLSPQDLKAPSLAEAVSAGALPTWAACLARYEELAPR